MKIVEIVAKGFCKLPNLFILIKQKSLSPPRNLALATSGELLIVVPNKAQSVIPPLFNDTQVLLISQSCFAEIFFKNSSF